MPGFREFYGLSVFHCPDCDGYEVSDKRVAVLSGGRKAVAFTLGLLTWTDRLTLITGGGEEQIGDEDREKLELAVVAVAEGSMAAVHIHKSLIPDARRA
jgi:thioredoxin reductase